MAVLSDLVNAAGQGIIHRRRLETEGKDYMAQEQERAMAERKLQAALAAQEIERKYNLTKLKGAETDIAAEEAEATAAGQPNVAAMRAARSIEDRTRQQATSEAALGKTGAEIDELGSRANYNETRGPIALETLTSRNQQKDEDQSMRRTLIALTAANIRSQIADREATVGRRSEPRAASAGGANGDILNAESFPGWYKQAKEAAMLRYDNPGPKEVEAVLQEMLSQYRGVASGSRTPGGPTSAPAPSAAPPPAAALRPGASPSPAGARPKMFKYQGQMVPFEQLPPAVQQAAKAKGLV
jgi:hypothetical protein